MAWRSGLAEWSTADVCDWALGSLKLPGDTVQRLRENEVDGLVLTTLTEVDMQTMGIHQLGFRRRLFLGLQGLLPGGGKTGASDAGALEAADCRLATASAAEGAAVGHTRTRSASPLPRQVRLQDHAGVSVLPGADSASLEAYALWNSEVERRDSWASGDHSEGNRSMYVGLRSSQPTVGIVSKLVGKIQHGSGLQAQAPQVLRPEETPEAPEVEALAEDRNDSQQEAASSSHDRNDSKEAASSSDEKTDEQLQREAEEALWYEMLDPFDLEGGGAHSEAHPRRSRWVRQSSSESRSPSVRSLSPVAKTNSQALSSSDLMDALFFDPMDLTADIQPASLRERRVRMASDEDDGRPTSSIATSCMESRVSHKTSGGASMAVSEFWQDVTASRAKYRTPKLRLSLSSARERIAREEEESEEGDDSDDEAAAHHSASVSPRPRDDGEEEEDSEEPSESDAAHKEMLAKLAAIRSRRKQRQGLAAAAAASCAAEPAGPASLTADALRAHERLGETSEPMVQTLFSKISEEDPSGAVGGSLGQNSRELTRQR